MPLLQLLYIPLFLVRNFVSHVYCFAFSIRLDGGSVFFMVYAIQSNMFKNYLFESWFSFLSWHNLSLTLVLNMKSTIKN